MSDWSDIGTELRSKREASGQSLQDVSHRTRIPVATLARLEENDYSRFPGAAYTRGFLAQYSEHLDLDATDWLDRLESGNTFANLDSIGYLRGTNETLNFSRDASTPRPPKPTKPGIRTVPAVSQAPDVFQHLIVLTMTALFLAGGVYGFIRISDRIENTATGVDDGMADSPPPPVLAPVPNVVPSRPAPPTRPRAFNRPAPAVAEVVNEGTDEGVQPTLVSDGTPPRAVIIDE